MLICTIHNVWLYVNVLFQYKLWFELDVVWHKLSRVSLNAWRLNKSENLIEITHCLNVFQLSLNHEVLLQLESKTLKVINLLQTMLYGQNSICVVLHIIIKSSKTFVKCNKSAWNIKILWKLNMSKFDKFCTKNNSLIFDSEGLPYTVLTDSASILLLEAGNW